MAGHSRSKNGVPSGAYVPAIHDFLFWIKTWMAATSAAMMAESAAPAKDYASPEVSNIAASSASLALLPAQTTNWNAVK